MREGRIRCGDAHVRGAIPFELNRHENLSLFFFALVFSG